MLSVSTKSRNYFHVAKMNTRHFRSTFPEIRQNSFHTVKDTRGQYAFIHGHFHQTIPQIKHLDFICNCHITVLMKNDH